MTFAELFFRSESYGFFRKRNIWVFENVLSQNKRYLFVFIPIFACKKNNFIEATFNAQRIIFNLQ